MRLLHYAHHLFIGIAGLVIASVGFGSVTIWEVMLFLFMAYIPLLDEFFYATLHYIDSPLCRNIIHYFFLGDLPETIALLHEHRLSFTERTLHNIFAYSVLWALCYISFIFNMSLLYFTLAGILTHLFQDIINDYYEFQSIKHWFWPIHYLFAP